MLMYIGTGLALTNWLSVLMISVAGALGYIYRVHVESGRYEQYMRRTKRFVPFVF
jgi:protein-S-isoprenylcysteine O-methyltransferase Ste14